MTAKKTAARNVSGAKSSKTKASARKAPATKAAKTAPKQTAKMSNAQKPAQKPTAKKPVATAAPKTAAKAAAPMQPEKKPAAAASRAKPAPSASFNPERRLELIAAAAARRRKTVTAKAAPSPIAVMQPREPSPVERHRFSVGDQVRVVSTSGMWFKHGIEYRVTAALPPQAGKLQYRIKNEQEPFERVVSESQLASVQASAQRSEARA